MPSKVASKPLSKQGGGDVAPPSPKSRKLSYKEQRELEELPEFIAQLEAEQSVLAIELAAPDIYRQNPAEAKRMAARVEAIEVELLAALEKWEMIEARSRA